MQLTEYIQLQRAKLENHIAELLHEKKMATPPGLHTLTDTLEHLDLIIPKGKLLRGLQVLLSHEMYGGKNIKGALDSAAALEIIQAAILIQDDFMDNDYTRRGIRSVFAQYIDVGKKQKNHDPLLYGQSMATCVGDIGFFLAYELISQCSSEQHVVSEIVALFSKEWQLVGAGQMMDVDFASRMYEPTEEEIMNIYRYKTARYSFSLPLSMGAILAGAEASVIQKLHRLGEDLGIIFQIKDDELGLFGDEKITGKPVSSDIRENKKTLIRSLLYSRASSDEKIKLNNLFGSHDLKEEDITYIKDLVSRYGVDSTIRSKIGKMSDEVLQAINSLSVQKEYKNLLQELVQLNLNRKK